MNNNKQEQSKEDQWEPHFFTAWDLLYGKEKAGSFGGKTTEPATDAANKPGGIISYGI